MDTILKCGIIALSIALLFLMGVAWQEFGCVWGGDSPGSQVLCGLAGGHVQTVFGIVSRCAQ